MYNGIYNTCGSKITDQNRTKDGKAEKLTDKVYCCNVHTLYINPKHAKEMILENLSKWVYLSRHYYW